MKLKPNIRMQRMLTQCPAKAFGRECEHRGLQPHALEVSGNSLEGDFVCPACGLAFGTSTPFMLDEFRALLVRAIKAHQLLVNS